MHSEETCQRNAAQIGSPAQDAHDEITDHWNCAGNLGAYRGSPVRALVPGQQVTSEAHAQRCQQKNDPGEPGDLARKLVGCKEKGAQHVQEHENNHQGSAPMVDAADKPAKGYFVHDVLDAVIGIFR